jgi:hypothetical protein
MDKKQDGQWVVPNPQIPRSFGLMNIIFGVILIVYAIALALLFYIMPVLSKPIQAQVQKQVAEQRSKHQGKIASLKEKLKAAKNDDEKKDIEIELGALEADPVPDPAIFDDMMGLSVYTDYRIVIYQWADSSTGILLNLLMIIAGAGLLALAEWGRRLAIAVAWLKIARWILIVVVNLVLVIPVTTEKTQPTMAKIDAQISVKSGGRAATPFPMRSLAQFQAVAGAVMVVAGALIASVYPAVSLWFLTRPRARAACLAASSPSVVSWPPPGGEPAQT